VAGLLAGTDEPEAAGRMLDALERITRPGRETWRDARRALLVEAGALGGPELADRVRPYLRDYDPVVARAAAEVLGAWTGEAVRAAPVPGAREPVPSPTELDALARTDAVLVMRRGDRIRLRLLVDEAPLNTARFARLARAGYYDGLTFHRVVPNFVVQGGSPAANEYRGADRFSRDEVGRRSHWRGTVGVSTRGRDTGDAQLFVNLVHNVRLDHEYTVFAEVVDGMDGVERIREGDVIERVEWVVREDPAPASLR
ncbi:MAG: peptidylprolyl isomerase, partial [Gemmatimonadetes bacterium]